MTVIVGVTVGVIVVMGVGVIVGLTVGVTVPEIDPWDGGFSTEAGATGCSWTWGNKALLVAAVRSALLGSGDVPSSAVRVRAPAAANVLNAPVSIV